MRQFHDRYTKTNQKDTKMTKNNSLNKTAVKQSITSSNNQVDQAQTIDLKNKTRMLLASPFYKQKFETRYMSGVSDLDDNTRLTIKQYPEGFCMLEELPVEEATTEYGEHWMYYACRKMAVSNPGPARKPFEELDLSKSRRKRNGFNQVINYWNQLFPNNGDVVNKYGHYSIISKQSKDVSKIGVDKVRKEHYIPFAFTEEGVATGGLYMYLGYIGEKNQLSSTRPSISESPIKEFFAGACMFGATLYGKDQLGQIHPITHPRYVYPDNCVITDIYMQNEFHPYEKVSHKTMKNNIPLLKVLGQTETPSVNHHLPIPDYIIYGINSYLSGGMNKDALAKYIRIVKQRGALHSEFIQKNASINNVSINTSSALSPLGLEQSKPEEAVSDLFKKLDMMDMYREEFPAGDELESIRKKVFLRSLTYLSNCGHETSEIWSYVKESIENEEFSFSDEELSDLHLLNYLDYCVNLAKSVKKHGDRQVCVTMPAMESPIQNAYKRMFAKKFGAVMFVNWISPITVKDYNYGHRIFYLEHSVNNVNDLLDRGIVENCFMQTASIALDSTKIASDTAIKVKTILSEHEMRVQLDEIMNNQIQQNAV